MNKQLKYYGHACFELTYGDTTVLFDPFFTNNPVNTSKATDIKRCDYIFVSHGHSDHLGDAVELSKATGATIISTAEIGNMCLEKGCSVHKMHLGGKRSFDFGSVRLTPAMHGAGIPGGHAAGFVIDFFGTNIYFAGDTGLFGDMALIGRLTAIDYAFLPIGDNFTMGPQDAALAAEMLKAKAIIPMHYNTWDLIKQNPADFKQEVAKVASSEVLIVAPGQEITLK